MDKFRTQNYGPEEITIEDARKFMMAWEAEQKGIQEEKKEVSE